MRRVLVDFDGTIIKKAPDGKFRMHNGAKAALDQMKANGYEIIIFTSRCADSENRNAKENTAVIHNYLTKNKIPHDRITAEKISADYYIDDKAIRFVGNWDHVMEKINGQNV